MEARRNPSVPPRFRFDAAGAPNQRFRSSAREQPVRGTARDERRVMFRRGEQRGWLRRMRCCASNPARGERWVTHAGWQRSAKFDCEMENEDNGRTWTQIARSG
jgi:hypothetical protein